jgi:hypothetical protein
MQKSEYERIHCSFVPVIFTPKNERGLKAQPLFQQKAFGFQKQLQHGELDFTASVS